MFLQFTNTIFALKKIKMKLNEIGDKVCFFLNKSFIIYYAIYDKRIALGGFLGFKISIK